MTSTKPRLGAPKATTRSTNNATNEVVQRGFSKLHSPLEQVSVLKKNPRDIVGDKGKGNWE